jgi:transposase
MEERLCQGCLALRRRIATLETEKQRLLELLEAERRKGKRQAAPFAKGTLKKKPKKPGRKAGDDYGNHGHRPPPPAEQIDEIHEAPLPDVCPDCGGPLDETQVAQQYQVEIPRRPIHRQFNVHVGQCRDCGQRVQGRHVLQTSDALGAAASQLGPDAQAAIVELNKNAGLSHGKVSSVFRNLFGIQLTRGGSAHVVLRAGRRCQPIYQAICRAVRRSAWAVGDETGWRVGGRLAWLHGFVARRATAYVVDPTRSHAPAERLLGLAYRGILIHDGWSPYDRFEHARHQQCLQHLLRRCAEMLETATGAAVCFPRRIAALLREGLALRDRYAAGELNALELEAGRGRLQQVLEDAVYPPKTNAANERLAAHLWQHIDELLTFLAVPGLDATNWRAELAMRFGVILRKVWGGNRTWPGARAQAVLMSVWRTCWQRGIVAVDYLSERLRCRAIPVALPP